MPLRILLVLGLVYFGWRLWQNFQRRQQQGMQPPPRNETYELTVRCRQCGVYLPQTALSRDGRCGKCKD